MAKPKPTHLPKSSTNQKPIKLSCDQLWKVYGPNPVGFLDNFPQGPGTEDFTQSGYIGAVRGVSLEVRQGGIFVIMGLSGSGKSTVVRCMTRLVETTRGHILFDGQDLSTLSQKEMIHIRRHKMGMVFQNFGLLPHRNVMDNVAFPLEVQGIKRPIREERAREIIELVGLEGRERNFPRELSGGQQQRVGIARSLVVQPEVWFLDEPFSALDPLIRREMQDEFMRLQKLLQKTIVFITHDINEAVRIADHIVIMKDGQVIQEGTPEEVVSRPADGYVADFVREVPLAKVLSVSAIMSQPDSNTPTDRTVSANTKLEALAEDYLADDRPIAVLDDKGGVVGVVNRQALLEALLGGRGKP